MTTLAAKTRYSPSPRRQFSRRERGRYRNYHLSVLLLGASLLAGCADPRPATMELSGETMGTTWSVKFLAEKTSSAKDAIETEIEQALEAVNDMMSTYREDSVLSRFNANDSVDWQSVPAPLVHVLSEAQAISEWSNGAFDVTVGPLVNLWGFGPGASAGVVPDEEAIGRTKAVVGYDKIALRDAPPALRKSVAGVYVDLSAIAKGYGVDRVAELLEQHGIQNYLVEIGGELRGNGRNQHDKAWRIAVEKPDDQGRALHLIVPLDGSGMATSGDYRNFFVDQGGQRYSHTIDVGTGRPVTHTLASVTVIAPNCTRADGLATALLALGPDTGFSMAQQAGIAALFIERTDDGFRDRATDAFNKVIEETRQNA